MPSRIVSFSAFRRVGVLVPNDPVFRDYGRNPYASYDTASVPFLYRADLPKNIPAMARVALSDRRFGYQLYALIDGFSLEPHHPASRVRAARDKWCLSNADKEGWPGSTQRSRRLI